MNGRDSYGLLPTPYVSKAKAIADCSENYSGTTLEEHRSIFSGMQDLFIV